MASTGLAGLSAGCLGSIQSLRAEEDTEEVVLETEAEDETEEFRFDAEADRQITMEAEYTGDEQAYLSIQAPSRPNQHIHRLPFSGETKEWFPAPETGTYTGAIEPDPAGEVALVVTLE